MNKVNIFLPAVNNEDKGQIEEVYPPGTYPPGTMISLNGLDFLVEKFIAEGFHFVLNRARYE
jgi:hypothetical protein